RAVRGRLLTQRGNPRFLYHIFRSSRIGNELPREGPGPS
ncbi:MAG: hypothetical protein ACI91B_002459, partial [Planctomycetota bacterium]